jgi:hypothetical protein
MYIIEAHDEDGKLLDRAEHEDWQAALSAYHNFTQYCQWMEDLHGTGPNKATIKLVVDLTANLDKLLADIHKGK